MKKFIAVLACVFIFGFIHSQIEHRCGSHHFIEYQDQRMPGFRQHVNEQFELAKSNSSRSGELYTIQVVVHIVYNTANQNLTDDVVFNQMEILNRDFQRQNADTSNMRAEFDVVKGNPNIQFVLASLDPNGNPTTGITRTQTSTVSFGSELFFEGDFADLESVKSTANGGIDPWDQSRYLNIWVCNMDIFGTTAILGYASPPAGLPNWDGLNIFDDISDGVVIQYQYFGSNNPNPGDGAFTVLGRTMTHEVGHYLGLRHIWGDGDCSEEDGIDDTPNADESGALFVCDNSLNTCVDNIFGVDLPDMVENYMNYSPEDCQNTFTQGQVDLMRGVLQNQRIELIENGPFAQLQTNDNMQLILYPNPTSDKIQVQSIHAGIVEIFDAFGKLLSQKELERGHSTIDVSEFANGTYFIRFYNATSIQTKRIVVIK